MGAFRFVLLGNFLSDLGLEDGRVVGEQKVAQQADAEADGHRGRHDQLPRRGVDARLLDEHSRRWDHHHAQRQVEQPVEKREGNLLG